MDAVFRFTSRRLLVASVGVATVAYACANEVVGNFVGGPGDPGSDAAGDPPELIPLDASDASAPEEAAADAGDATSADADAD